MTEIESVLRFLTFAVFELSHLAGLDVVKVDPHIGVPVVPLVGVVEGQAVEDLVDDGPQHGAAAQRCQGHLGVGPRVWKTEGTNWVSTFEK